ncbi:MAG: SdpI family protein [Sarcina sp.]
MREIILFICDVISVFLTPIILLVVAKANGKKPSKYNSGVGYCTPYAKKSVEIWDFAQRLAPKVMIQCAKISFMIIVVLQMFKDIEGINSICMNIWIVILPMYFIIMELKLKKEFEGKIENL